MKVTVKTVSDRITILENQKTISINEEFQLACLRKFLAFMTSLPVKLPHEWVYIRFTDRSKSQRMKCQIAWSDSLNSVIYDEEGAPCLLSNSAFEVIGAANYAVQTLDEKRVEFIQSLAEDPALLSGKSGLLKYKFDQHWFAVDGCRETATHYVARLVENGVVTHYAKSLYDFRPENQEA